MNTPFKAGQIVYIEFSGSIGREQTNKRPCVVVWTSQRLGLLGVLPLTHGADSLAAFPTVLELASTQSADGKISRALCHQLRSVSGERIDANSRIKEISAQDLAQIRLVCSQLVRGGLDS